MGIGCLVDSESDATYSVVIDNTARCMYTPYNAGGIGAAYPTYFPVTLPYLDTRH